MKIEIHCHTERSSCSSITLKQLIEEALRLGIDCLCITDHNRFPEPGVLPEHEERYGIRLIPGIEWSTDWGHFLIFGMESMAKDEYVDTVRRLLAEAQSYPGTRVPLGHFPLSGEFAPIMAQPWFPAGHLDLARHVQSRGGCIIWAHPFDNNSALRKAFNLFVRDTGDISPEGFERHTGNDVTRHELLEFLRSIDGIEIRNGFDNQTGVEGWFTERLAARFGLAAVGSSDIHSKKMIGSHVMDFGNDILNATDLIAEIRSGRFRILSRQELMIMNRKDSNNG